MWIDDISNWSSFLGCVYPKVGIISVSMTQSLHEFVLEQLKRSKGKWPAVAEGSGVSKRTIEKIADETIADPGVSHIEKLARYFRDEAAA